MGLSIKKLVAQFKADPEARRPAATTGIITSLVTFVSLGAASNGTQPSAAMLTGLAVSGLALVGSILLVPPSRPRPFE